MKLSRRVSRSIGFLIILVATSLLISRQGFTQTPQTEKTFPNLDAPRINISNASVVTIESWGKNEVTVAAEVLAATLRIEEVSIVQTKDKLDVSCHPAESDRKIHLTVRVPSKAVLEIKSDGNTVQVKEPSTEQINIIFASKQTIQLSVPESTALDMQYAPPPTLGGN